MTQQPIIKVTDFLTVYFRSRPNSNGFVPVSGLVSRLFRDVHYRHPKLFDIENTDDHLAIKLTDYGQAFWDGINTHRAEYP